MKYLKYAGFGILGLGFVALAIFVTMSLWNWLVPDLFNGPVIGYWQTAGLFLLAKILFAGVSPGSKHKSSSYDHKWKRKYMDKYKKNCPEVEDVKPAEEM